ncbi:MAG: glycosyltransferase family 39 protein [Burkholderiaceae bacterium]
MKGPNLIPMRVDPKNAGRALIALLALLLLARLAAMAWLPLMDTTEARYGEIARKMAELGNWVTPFHDVGVPFWGKPPLSFWLTAASFRLFGVSEFAARLPHLLCGLGMLALVGLFARRRFGAREALLSVALLAGAALFFVSSGAVMTDAALVLCTTLAMVAFWLALHGESAAARRLHGWLFFVALGLGLLAKGPLVWVLVGLPLLPWLLWTRRWGEVWRGLPWLGGLLLMLAIAAPWYVLAEARTPGFLNYFLLGEHWHRFVTPGWKGDLYGRAHSYPIGTIWIFALSALLPWTLLLPLAGWRRGSGSGGGGELAPASAAATLAQRQQRGYLLLWALMPLLFFSAARNIIWPYVLPAMPAAALLAADWLARRNARAERWVAAGLAFTLLVSVGGAIEGLRSGRIEAATAKPVVRLYQAQHPVGQPLIYLEQRPFSANFYSLGQARLLKDAAELAPQLGAAGAYVVLPPDLHAEQLGPGLRVDAQLGRRGKETLLLVRPLTQGAAAP